MKLRYVIVLLLAFTSAQAQQTQMDLDPPSTPTPAPDIPKTAITPHASKTTETPKPTPTPKAPPAAAPKSTTMLITRAVGEVGEQVITSREVRLNDAVEQALNKKPAMPEGYRILSGSEKSFPAEVGKVLDEWIVYLEAKSLSTAPLARGDIGATAKTVTEFWASKPGWVQLEVSQDELRTMVERKMIAREFERLKSDPQLAPVSDDDALAYYRKNRLKFGNLPFSSLKDNIKTFLVKQQTERRLAEWRELLRRKYKTRNLIAG